jgi:hypothetical protein
MVWLYWGTLWQRDTVMAKHERRARYYIVRGNQALWKGDPARSGSRFRQVFITSNEFNSTLGLFQVCGLEGTGNGVQAGKFSISENVTVLFDGDFRGLEAAGGKFGQMVDEARADGFDILSFVADLEFQARLRDS